MDFLKPGGQFLCSLQCLDRFRILVFLQVIQSDVDPKIRILMFKFAQAFRNSFGLSCSTLRYQKILQCSQWCVRLVGERNRISQYGFRGIVQIVAGIDLRQVAIGSRKSRIGFDRRLEIGISARVIAERKELGTTVVVKASNDLLIREHIAGSP